MDSILIGNIYSIQLDKKEANWTTHQSDFSDVNSFHRHFAFYNRFLEYRNQIPIFERLFSECCENRWASSTISKVKAMADWKTSGYRNAVWVNLTSPDIHSIGYQVVRVIIPGLAYLTGSHKTPFLGAQDFLDYPDLFTSFPHPFP